MGYMLGRLLCTLTTGLFVTYLVALSPHLVHHLFDYDHDRPVCPHLAQSQQTPELQPDPPTLTPPLLTEGVQVVFAQVLSSAPDLPCSRPRAPPRSAPSA